MSSHFPELSLVELSFSPKNLEKRNTYRFYLIVIMSIAEFKFLALKICKWFVLNIIIYIYSPPNLRQEHIKYLQYSHVFILFLLLQKRRNSNATCHSKLLKELYELYSGAFLLLLFIHTIHFYLPLSLL